MDATTLNERHFEFLRLAKVRGLTAKRIGEAVYLVPSYTHKADGIQWVVTFPGLTCSCPALGYCSHIATAVDHYFTREADAPSYVEYTNELISDRYYLALRIRSGHTTKNDRTYMRYALKVYERRREAARVPPVVETVVKRNGRTRRLTRCGSYTI